MYLRGLEAGLDPGNRMVSTSGSEPIQSANSGSAFAWPRVSIVTPSYNQAEFLEQTVRSVLTQGYPNLEYIIMDGGSCDGSIEIIRRHEPFIDYWESAPDRGQSHALNKGWRRATGDILAYLNSDDVFRPEAIRRSVSYLIDHPEASLVYGFANVIDERGKLLYRMRPGEIDIRQMLRQNQMPQPTVFFRRELIDRFGLFDESLHFDLEYEFWLRAIDTTRFARIPYFLADMRLHAESKSAAQNERFYPEHLRVLDKVFNRSGPWTDDPSMSRSAYLPVVLYGIGRSSVFSPSERARAIEILHALRPKPTPKEVASIITFHDSMRAALASNTDTDPIADGSVTLPVLESEGILGPTEVAAVRRRVLAVAVARLASDTPELSRRLALLLQSLRQDPTLIIYRQWWSIVVKSSPFGWTAVHAFRLVRDRVLAGLRRPRPPERLWSRCATIPLSGLREWKSRAKNPGDAGSRKPQ
jgi:glycosyltransferase involved in cell wall biosynthesis